MSDNPKTTKELEEIRTEITGIRNESSENNGNKKKSFSASSGFKIIEAFFYGLVMFWVFMRFGFIGADYIAELITNSLSFFSSSTVLGIWDAQAYMGFIVIICLFFIYTDLFFLFPITYRMTIREDPLKKINEQIKTEISIIGILLLPLILSVTIFSVFFPDTFGQDENSAQFNAKTESTWDKLMKNKGVCMLLTGDFEKCTQKAAEVDAIISDRAELVVRHVKDSSPNYIEDLHKWQQSRPKYYIYYEMQAKGNAIYLDRIECYKNSYKPANLISNISLENREIISDDIMSIPEIYCDLSKLNMTEKISKDFQLKLVLYYSIKSTYTQTVPFYNMDKVLEQKYGQIDTETINIFKEESNIRKNLGKTAPESPNNIVSYTTYFSPELPIFYGNIYEESPTYHLTANFGKGETSDTLTNIQILKVNSPSSITLNCQGEDCNNDFGTSTYDNKAQAFFDFSVSNPNTERDIYNEKFEFEVQTSFAKKSSIAITIKCPDCEEVKKDSSSQTTNTKIDNITYDELYFDLDTQEQRYNDFISENNDKKSTTIESNIKNTKDKLKELYDLTNDKTKEASLKKEISEIIITIRKAIDTLKGENTKTKYVEAQEQVSQTQSSQTTQEQKSTELTYVQIYEDYSILKIEYEDYILSNPNKKSDPIETKFKTAEEKFITLDTLAETDSKYSELSNEIKTLALNLKTDISALTGETITFNYIK